MKMAKSKTNLLRQSDKVTDQATHPFFHTLKGKSAGQEMKIKDTIYVYVFFLVGGVKNYLKISPETSTAPHQC